MTVTLDTSCPITPLLPYLLNGTAAEEWAQREADSFGTSLPVAVALVVGSALLLLAGERLTRAALFLCGFLVTFVVSLFVANGALSLASASPSASCITLIAVPVVLGLVGGCMMLWLLTLAFSCLGFAAGAALAQALYILVLHRVTFGVTVLSHDLFYFVLLFALAIPGAFLMAKYRESLMIWATAALGSVGLVPGLALLVLSRIDSHFLWVTDPTDANAHRASPFVYGQVLAILVYFPVGVGVQRALARRKKAAAVHEQTAPYLLHQGPGYSSA